MLLKQNLNSPHKNYGAESIFANTKTTLRIILFFVKNFVKISGTVNNLWSLPSQEKVTIVLNQGANVAAKQNKNNNDQNTGSEEREKPDEEIKNNDNQQDSLKEEKGSVTGKVLVLNDKAMEIHTFNAEASKYYADFINDFQKDWLIKIVKFTP